MQGLKIAGKEVVIDRFKLAPNATSSVLVEAGSAQVLVTVVVQEKAEDDVVNLVVNFEEKYYATGKIPQNYHRRETFPSLKATLLTRLIDRSIRPLIKIDSDKLVQVTITLFGTDEEIDPGVIALLGTSISLARAQVPMYSHMGMQYQSHPDYDLRISANAEKIFMIEGTLDNLELDQVMNLINQAHNQIKEQVHFLEENFPRVEISEEAEVSDEIAKVREQIITKKKRLDGRGFDEVREVSGAIDVLECAHGSGLFNRGNTQSLVSLVLGSKNDELSLDSVFGNEKKKFFLHYNFPSFSVGETSRSSSVSRRELGHGQLAENALMQIMPTHEEFPYTIRLVSEILGSDGSSSQASICAGSLALMSAGVPVKEHISGVAIGLIPAGEEQIILTDICEEEDKVGVMDFKVSQTRRGICTLQLDLKVPGVSGEIIEKALKAANGANHHILEQLETIISAPRASVKPGVPVMKTTQIDPTKVRDFIGKGGENINKIIASTGVKIDILNQGKLMIFGPDQESINRALEEIKKYQITYKVDQVHEVEVLATSEKTIDVQLDYQVVTLDKLTPETLPKTGDKVRIEITSVDALNNVSARLLKNKE